MPVTIEVLGIDAVLQRLQIMQWSLSQSPRAIVQEVAKIAKEAMQNEAPVKTGALQRGIHYRTFEGDPEGFGAWARFYDDEEYTVFVIEGTAGHSIYAGFITGGGEGKKALYWPGADHPVIGVYHPGTQANDFVARAMDEVERAADEVLNGVGEAIVNGERIEAA